MDNNITEFNNEVPLTEIRVFNLDIFVTQCQPENTHGEFQPSNRNELLPQSPLFHAKERRSTDPITNVLVQRYGRLREWFWTPSSLHSRA